MGELHIEVIRDRIFKEYKVNADLGPLQIAYCEIPKKQITDVHSLETKIGNSKQQVTMKLSLLPYEGTRKSKEILKLDKTPEYASNIANIYPKHLVALKRGVEIGLGHGPKLSCQVKQLLKTLVVTNV